MATATKKVKSSFTNTKGQKVTSFSDGTKSVVGDAKALPKVGSKINGQKVGYSVGGQVYASGKDAPGYFDTFEGKGQESPGKPLLTDTGTSPIPPLEQTNQGTEAPTPMTDARTTALSKLKEIGYGSPDEGEIQGMMSELAAGNPMFAEQPKTNIQKGFESAVSSGAPVPTSLGQARMQAKSYIPQDKVISPVDSILQQDEGLMGIADMYKEFMSNMNQRDSLTETYRDMIKDSGIEDIDTELIDMKNVIEGTEDDIRTEVMKAGGFATDSQVMALTNARNKQLVKNYNTLLETRNAKAQYIDTLIGLEGQDRQYASQQFDRMMNFGFQMQQMQTQMQQNAQNQYYKVAEAMGWDGLYNSAQGNAYTVGLIEKTLGMPPGGLAQAAQSAQSQKAYQNESNQLDLQLKRSNLATAGLQQQKLMKDLMPVPEGVMDKEIRKEVVGSNEYKTITTSLPALRALKTYSDLIETYGTSEKLNGAAQGELQAAYGNAVTAWKSLAALGALSGADYDLAENAVPAPSFFTRKSVQMGKVKGSMDTALNQAEILTQRLSQTYPEAGDFLNAQLEELKLQSAPEKIVTFSMMGDMDNILRKN